MLKTLEGFAEKLAIHAKDPLLYDELTLRRVLKETLEIVEGSQGADELAPSYIAAIESALHALSPELDRVSFGFGSAWAASVLLSEHFDRSHDRAKEARQFKCFQKHLGILREVEAHPLFSHTELAAAAGKTKSRLSQIVVELKTNRLLLVDKLGRENRYELTSLAKQMLREQVSRDKESGFGDNLLRGSSIGDVAERWVIQQSGSDQRIGMSNANIAMPCGKRKPESSIFSNAA